MRHTKDCNGNTLTIASAVRRVDDNGVAYGPARYVAAIDAQGNVILADPTTGESLPGLVHPSTLILCTMPESL